MGFFAKLKEQVKADYANAGGPEFEGYRLQPFPHPTELKHGLMTAKLTPNTRATVVSGHETSRMTATRIGAGAVLAGPVGAFGGALLRKHGTSDGYLTIEGGPSLVVQFDGDKESQARAFAAAVNSAAAAS